MERDQQRLLDVIGDPNALESFLGLSSFPAEHQTNRAYAQSPAIASPASVIQAASPFSAPFASASPNPANLRSPAPSPAPQPQPLQPVNSPAPNVQAGLRHAPSPLQQPMRPGSVPNTPVPSPVSYPPGPGPGVPISMANINPSVLQALHNSGAITINSSMLQGMPQIMHSGTVQQLMGGSMVHIVSAPSLAPSHPSQQFQQQQQPQPAQPQTVNLSSTPPLRPTPPTPGGRAKQPQLLPKPTQSNSNSNSPKTTNLARTVALKVPSPAPQPVPNPAPQLQHHLQPTQVQAQPSQQFFQTHHSSPQPNGGSIMFNQGAVLASQPGGAMVLNSVIPTLGHAPGSTNGVAAAGGQQFLIQQPGGGFQILVRPPTQTHTQSPAPSPQQQPARGHTILVPHPLGGLTNAQIIRPHTQSPLTAQTQQPQQQQPMLRLISPSLAAVQLQTIQTPNGPAYIVQQHANPPTVNLQTLTNLPNVRTVTAAQNATPPAPTTQLYHPNVNLVSVSEDRTTPQQVFNQEGVQNAPEPPPPQPPPPPAVPPIPEAPPPKKPPPKKRPKKKKKEEEKKEVKKLNLEELLKESGITGDDEDGGFDFGFGSMEEAMPNPQPLPPQPQPQMETPAIPTPEVLPVTSSVPLQLTIGEDGQLVFQGGQGLNSQEVSQVLRQALQQQGWSLATPREATERTLETPQVDQNKPIMQPVIQQTVQVSQGPTAQAQKDQQPSIGFQNSFLESLARSQNIPTPKKPKKSYPKKKKKKDESPAPPPTPAVSAVPAEAVPTAPMVVMASQAPNGQMNNGVSVGNNTQKNVQTAVNGMPTYIIAPGGGAVAQVTRNNPTPPSNATTVVSVVNISSGQMMPTNLATPTVVNAGGGNVVHRVQTIQLTPQNQQSLRNIQAQIQYLTSKNDPSPQESTLLQKLIQHQQKILMTGKPIPTIPGQHAQGVQFNAPANASSQNEPDQIPQHGSTMKGAHNKPVPANIQQNTHLANLLRGDRPAMASRMTTANVNQAAQPVRYFHQIGNQVISLTPQQSRPTTVVATAVPQQPIPATPTVPQPVRQVVIMPHALAQPVSSIIGTFSSSTSSSSSLVTATTPVMSASSGGAAAKVTVNSNMAAKVVVVPATSSSTVTTVASTSGTSNQGITTVVSSVTPETSSVTTSNIVTVVKTEPTTIAAPTFPRGIKRGAVTPPKPTISKSTLFEHQLKTDQNGALTPDCKSPFKNKSNACKRLIRYHVFHEKEPHPKEEEKAEEWFEATAEHFALKFRQMLNKYHYLLLMDSMKEAPASEYVMIDRLFVAEEKGTLERLKEEAAQPKKEEEVVPIPAMEEVIVKKEVESRFPKLKLSRKEGEHYKSELKEVRVVMEDVVRNGYFKKEGYEYDTTSQDSSNSMPSQSLRHQQQQLPASQQYDEWEAIRNEVAFFTQEEGGGAPGSSATAPFPIQDDLLHSQVQSAIDGILNLQKLEGDEDPSGLSAMDLESNTGAVGVRGHEAMDYETSLNDYEGSLMDECSDGATEIQGDVALNEAVRSILT